MTALSRLLFPAPALRRSPSTLFAWWESRRPMYNLIVGTSGLFSLGTISLMSLLPPRLPLFVPWQAVVVFGVCANVCYSFGFAIETLLERMWGGDVLPIGVAWLGYLFALVKWVVG